MATERQLYDTIGASYSSTRRADPRWMARFLTALGDAPSVLNVGAGTGSYEPTDRFVIALEPSSEMLQQRVGDAAPAVRGIAETLPFADDSFDAILAIHTHHHWKDQLLGFEECRRVARLRVVFATTDPKEFNERFWLNDYLPTAAEVVRTHLQHVDDLVQAFDNVRIEPLLVPHDCVDGFAAAFWRRPESYLDPAVRAGISWFHWIGHEATAAGCAHLQSDLNDGTWERKYGDLLGRTELDVGYKLIVAELRS